MHQIDNKDILIIINPSSGNRRSKRIIREISSLGLGISSVVTHNLNELEEVFGLNIEKFKAFIVVGGDGTVNETVKYLYGRNDKLLAVLPAGSGNGFARELGFKSSVLSLIDDVNKGNSIDVDVLSVNDSMCLNLAGLGFDSFVAHDFQKREGRGFKNYVHSTLKSIFAFKPFKATIKIGDEVQQGKYQMITIANTRQFGNNAIIAPWAKPNDGLIELVLAKPFPFYQYPIFVIRLFLGTLKSSKYLKFIKVKDSIELQSEFKQYHVDGEPKVFTDTLKIKMLQEKVRVIKTSHCKFE